MLFREELELLHTKIGRLRAEARIYNQTLGLRGVLAISTYLIFGYPKHVVLSTKGIKHPLSLRLRTSDADVYEDVILQREYDYPTSFSPHTIVDAGANCGMTSVFYANRYPEATVVAVEPEISNYNALVRNTRAYPNVIAVRAALWSEDGQVEVFSGLPELGKWGKWGFRVRKGNGCRALTLPTLMREFGIETVDILKIDVEGAEREIFSSCDWMNTVKLMAIELHDEIQPGCSDSVDAVTGQYHKDQRGFLAFYSRCP